MRRFVAALCLAFAVSAQASSNLSDLSDLWYAPGEDGWGVNIVLQNKVIFATFYVYDVNRNPVWFTAVLGYNPGFVFTGTLFADRGPWYGGAYDPATVAERSAGSATLTVPFLNQATLTYTIDGVTVTKSLQRLTFSNEDYTGTYAGGYSIRSTGCTAPGINGIDEVAGLLTVTQTGSSFHIVASASDISCTFNGTYVQAGKLGKVDGSYTCVDGTVGTFSLIEMIPTISGFTARASGQNQVCQWSGFMGGIHRAQ